MADAAVYETYLKDSQSNLSQHWPECTYANNYLAEAQSANQWKWPPPAFATRLSSRSLPHTTYQSRPTTDAIGQRSSHRPISTCYAQSLVDSYQLLNSSCETSPTATINQKQPFHLQSSTASSECSSRYAFVSMVSIFYATLMVILSFVFEVTNVSVAKGEKADYEPFYIYMYVLGIVFLGYYQLFLIRPRCSLLTRKVRAEEKPKRMCRYSIDLLTKDLIKLAINTSHSAEHSAGSLYLRLGAIVFGMVGVINSLMEVLDVVEDNALDSRCWNYESFAMHSLTALFFLAQNYFIFKNNRLTIHRYKTTCRMGLMHLCATNICTWIRTIVNEEVVSLRETGRFYAEFVELHLNRSKMLHSNPDKLQAILSASNHDHILMNRPWIDQDCVDSNTKFDAFLETAHPFMYTCIVEYSLICSAVMFILWLNVGTTPAVDIAKLSPSKLEIHMSCSHSTRGFFLGLLVLFAVVVSVSVYYVNLKENELKRDWFWLFSVFDISIYSLLSVVCLTTFWQFRSLQHNAQFWNQVTLLDDILLGVTLFGVLSKRIFMAVAMAFPSAMSIEQLVESIACIVQVLIQTGLILIGQRLTASNNDENLQRKPGRQLLMFLVVANLSIWVSKTFEVQRANHNAVMIWLFGIGPWTLIVICTVPLATFYRFHSSVCLADIWKRAYKDSFKLPI